MGDRYLGEFRHIPTLLFTLPVWTIYVPLVGLALLLDLVRAGVQFQVDVCQAGPIPRHRR